MFFTSRKNLILITKAANTAGMNIKTEKRIGLPYIFYRYRKRYGIPIGLTGAILIFILLSSMIWTVDISGNETVTTEDITAFLKSEGIDKGIFTSTVSGNDIEFMLENKFRDISWATVSVIGSRLFIEIKERTSTDEKSPEDIYSNIIASKDGEVVQANIFTGEGKIYPGTAVVKGDLLVSGVKTYNDGRVEFTKSSAEIMALTENHICSQTAFSITAEVPESCKDKYLPIFFNKHNNVKADCFTSTVYFLTSADIIFPIGVSRNSEISFKKVNIELTTAQALLLSFSDFSKTAFGLYEKVTVNKRDIKLNIDNQISVEGNFNCLEDIAIEKSFTVEDNEEIQ